MYCTCNEMTMFKSLYHAKFTFLSFYVISELDFLYILSPSFSKFKPTLKQTSHGYFVVNGEDTNVVPS